MPMTSAVYFLLGFRSIVLKLPKTQHRSTNQWLGALDLYLIFCATLYSGFCLSVFLFPFCPIL